MKKVQMIMALAMLAGSVAMANNLVFYNVSTEQFYGMGVESDGGGGYQATAEDDLGTWGDAVDYHPVLGDLDNDGLDSQLLVADSGQMYAKDYVSDGSGGMVIGGTQDDLGSWGNSSDYTRLTGDLTGTGTLSIVLYNGTNGALYAQDFISDGSGGYVNDGSSDDLGTWIGGYHALLGDLDGDGKDDEVLLVNDTGAMYARDLVSDGSGGLVIDVVGNQDALGSWGNSPNYSRGLGDVDGDGKDDIIIYNTATGGLYSRGFKDDGSGGLITDADSQETLSSNWRGGEGYMLLPDMGVISEPATLDPATITEMSFDTGVKDPITVLYADDLDRSSSTIGTTSTGGYSWDESGETNAWAFWVDGGRLVANGHDSSAGEAHVNVDYDLDSVVHYKVELDLSVVGKYGDVWTAIMPRASGSGINENGWRFRLPDNPGLYIGVGTHRLQMVWDAATETGTFGIDTNYTSGAFVADHMLVETNEGFDTNSNARLFFGGGLDLVVDDIAVTEVDSGITNSWSEDFAGAALPGNMELGTSYDTGDPGSISFAAGNATWSANDFRQFIKTSATNYNTMDFTFEATVTVASSAPGSSVFFGLGSGDCDLWMPMPAPTLSSTIDPRDDGAHGYGLAKDGNFLSSDSINVSFYDGTETAVLGSFLPQEDVKVAMDVNGSSATLTITDVAGTTTYVSDTQTVANAANDSNADYVSFAHTLDSENAYIDNLVVSEVGETVVGTTNYVKLTVNVPGAAASYFPEAATDLVASNWTTVAHSANGVDGFEITNLTHSTFLSDTNKVIYLKKEEANKFFRITAE